MRGGSGRLGLMDRIQRREVLSSLGNAYVISLARHDISRQACTQSTFHHPNP